MRIGLSSTPWQSACPPLKCSGGRPCITVEGREVRVVCGTISESLPVLAGWKDRAGKSWTLLELPSTSVRGEEHEDVAVAEELNFMIHAPGHRFENYAVVQSGGIPRPPLRRTAAEEGKEAGPYETCSALLAGMIDGHIDLVNRLADGAHSKLGLEWEGQARGLFFRPLRKALREWRAAAGRDEPRMALIVKLARDLDPLLPDVCRQPRVVLSRQRRMHDVARIQEVDTACLRWIGRQPGITVAQKAGPKQRLMGVVRVESADTLENRVVRDLVVRAIDASDRYLLEHRRHSSHERVKLVRSFRRKLENILKHSPIAAVRTLSGMPSPNYVLLHDRRYQKLWQAYLLLVLQQKQQDTAWRWQQRVWSEHCTLGLLDSLSRLPCMQAMARTDLLIHTEHEWGQFIDAQNTQVASWQAHERRSSAVVDFVGGQCLHRHPAIPAELARLAPDAVAVKRVDPANMMANRLVAVWTVLDFDLDGDHLRERTQSLSKAVQGIDASGQIRALLIQPNAAGLSPQIEEVEAQRCIGLRTATDLQDGLLFECVNRLLGT